MCADTAGFTLHKQVAAKAIDPDRLLQLADDMRLAGGDVGRFLRLRQRREGRSAEAGPRVRWLVDGLVPRGEVTLLVAEHMAGKSTLLHELCLKAATPEVVGEPAPEWLGRRVLRGAGGPAILVTLEESEGWLLDRERLIDPDGRAVDCLYEAVPAREPLAKLLADYGRLTPETGAPRLLVVDCASKIIQGSELSNENVNALFEPLEAFARATGAAVVLIHHLNKPDRDPRKRAIRTAADLRARPSGHAAFLNRPRVVIGMIREGDAMDAITRIGVIKENIGLGHLVDVMAPYRRDPVTWHHLPAPDAERPGGRRKAATERPASPAPQQSGPLTEQRVLAALARMVCERKRVTRSGNHGLHEAKPPELEGLGRDLVRAVLDDLIKAGRVVRAEDGALALADDDAGDAAVAA